MHIELLPSSELYWAMGMSKAKDAFLLTTPICLILTGTEFARALHAQKVQFTDISVSTLSLQLWVI